MNEYHQPFLEGYKHSRSKLKLPPPRHGYFQGSIEDVDPKALAKHIEKERESGHQVGFIGAPPCPDFSVAGKNRGHHGENGRLSRTYANLIAELKPDFFLFENVKGLYRTKKHRAFFEEMKANLRDGGYSLHERLINAIEYGAPQDRERIILVGFMNGRLPTSFDWGERPYPNRTAFDYPWPAKSAFVEDSQRERPNSIPLELTVQHWFERNDVSNHPNARHCFTPRAGLSRFLSVEEGDDSKKSYKRLHRWRYSPTAAYGNNEVHLHPYLARRISVSEALAIKSLPKEFELPASMTLSDMFKTVGNGVPFLAALGLSNSILHHLGSVDARYSKQHSLGDQQSAA